MTDSKLRTISRIGLAAGGTALLVLAATAQKQNAVPIKPIKKELVNSHLFESKIRPMLLDACIACHGKEHPQGNLRLDVPVTLEAAKEMLVRVKGEGGKQRMPIGNPLSKDKIAAIEQWVNEGAKWSQSKPLEAATLTERGKTHWAFQPLKRPKVPAVLAKNWVQNPIDAFVLKRLEAQKLKPSSSATRQELIRRLAYDLTGLPPTPEEVTAFVADKSPNAYEKLVDRLLASPHYGEKWARHWLDVVRYAESNSYERDNPKPHIHKYRDYVIRAFNSDKPYDRFLTEQLAGDELPETTGDGLIATGYYRLGIWDDEPADLKQAENDDLDDLVATTGQALLGLTLDCARCHDHKLDPIPQKDYYRFVSFFRNINRFKNGGVTDEALHFETPAQKQEYERKVAELTTKRQTNATTIASLETEYHTARAKLTNGGDIATLKYRYYEGAYGKIPDFDALKPVASGELKPAILDLKTRKRDTEIGFVFEGTLTIPKAGNYTFYFDTDDGSRLTVNGQKLLEKDSNGGQGMEKNATLALPAGTVPFRIDYFQGGGPFGLILAWSSPDFARRPLSTPENSASIVASPEFLVIFSPEKRAQYTQLLKDKEALAKEEVPTEKALVVTEMGKNAPDTFLMDRGDPHSPKDKVEPGFPLCAKGGPATVPTPPETAKSSGRRTALAQWIVAPENPLTARVMVNRVWQHHFGRGIVRTPNDFGLQGAAPTHPELLNWLAKEFITQGWSFKRLHRLILTSNTYKQSSRANAFALAKDPQNDLFWRFDMRRLTAEEIRDSLLAVSGNLNSAMYGTPIYPEIAKELLASQSRPGNDWETEKMKPEDQNRRSIYIHVKRSLIYPLLAIFDLPDTDRSSAGRFASTQPTQALGMMNSPLLNKQAAVLAARVRKEGKTENKAFAGRVLALIMQRPSKTAEIAECVALIQRLQKRGAKPEQAQTYLALMALNLDEFLYLD